MHITRRREEIADGRKHGHNEGGGRHAHARCVQLEVHVSLPLATGNKPNQQSNLRSLKRIRPKGNYRSGRYRAGKASRRMLVTSLPRARMRAIACPIGSRATAMWNALA